MTKQKTIIYAVVGIIAVVAVYAMVLQPFFKYQKVNVNPEETTLKEVSCDIAIANPRGLPLIKYGDLVIESASCQQQYVSNCGRFGIFSDVGTIRLEAEGGLGSGADIKIAEGSSQSYTLGWCGSKLTKVFKAKLFNENNDNIQTKEIRLQ